MRAIIKTPANIIKKYVGNIWNFKKITDAQKWIRKNNKTPDYIAVNGILYTMDEYDMAGESITYLNKRNMLMLEVYTKDRYNHETGFKDAELEIYDAFWWRNDLTYAD